MTNSRMVKYYIEFSLVIILFTGYIVYSTWNNEENRQKKEQEYFEKSFSGILKYKWVNRGLNVVLDIGDKKKKYSLRSSSNYNIRPNNLSDFIRKGDSLVKIPNSMELYIYRNDKKYHFTIGEEINR